MRRASGLPDTRKEFWLIVLEPSKNMLYGWTMSDSELAVIRKNSIRTEHLCNQQLSKPRTKLRLEAIQNVTMLHRAEKAAARSFCGAQR